MYAKQQFMFRLRSTFCGPRKGQVDFTTKGGGIQRPQMYTCVPMCNACMAKKILRAGVAFRFWMPKRMSLGELGQWFECLKRLMKIANIGKSQFEP